MQAEKQQRPGGETEALENRWAATGSSVGRDEGHVADLPADDVVRCSRCHHPLRNERSIALELGPVCRKAGAA